MWKMYELGSTCMFQCQNYGGPCLQTQHNIFGTKFNFVKHNTKLSKQHKIFETQHKITETQCKIIETQHKVVETQHKIIETTQNIGGPLG